MLDSTIATVADEVAAKANTIAQAVADSISNSNTQILKAGSISQIASYQKAVLDDENSLIASVFSSLTNATSLLVKTVDEFEAAAREALTLGVNVSPFITLDSLVNIKENVLAGDGLAIASVSDPEGESVTLTLGGADAEFLQLMQMERFHS